MCPGWPWQGTLCPVTESQSCAVRLTLGVGVCDVPSRPWRVSVLLFQARLCLEALWVPCFGSARTSCPSQWTWGPRLMGPSSFMDLPAGASVGVVVSVLFLSSSPCLCCPPFSRGAEDGRLGMRVGSDRVLVWGLGQGVPQSQAVSPLAPGQG